MSAAGIGIIVLAAGESRRFGSPKLVVPIGGVALVRRATLEALAASATVVVMTGAHREIIESHIDDLSAARVFNAEWSTGMGGSIAKGITALATRADIAGAIITLPDQALIVSADLTRLIAVHERAPQRIIAAAYADVVGPPCLFPRAYFAELAALHGTSGARVLLERHAANVDIMPLPSAAIDIDTPEDYRRVTRT